LLLIQPFSDLDEMDYEDEFDIDRHNEFDADDDDRSFHRRSFGLEDSKTLAAFPDGRKRRLANDTTLTTMSYKGAQVVANLFRQNHISIYLKTNLCDGRGFAQESFK
jgi:hypothetical protein